MSAHDNIESALLGYCVPSWTPTCQQIAAAMAALVGRKNDLSFCLFHPRLFSHSFLTSEPISSLLHGSHGPLLVIFDEFGSDQVKLRLEGRWEWWGSTDGPEVVESKVGVVAADDGRCSEIRVGVLKADRHAVDAVVATTLCLRVVH